MSSNLIVLNISRLKISNNSFIELFGSSRPIEDKEENEYDDDEPPVNNHYLKNLEKLDISECFLVETSGMLAMTEACGDALKELKASNT